ncbi:MAG: hypothetical protein HY078_13440 [Elusimicrobia bacterium]|nr:hypothetical protein [Elusimicrobiota bacterium]
MAILAMFTAPDLKKSHYETLRKEVDWEHRQPEGMIFHAAGFDPAGNIHVADVWASQEALDGFFKTRLLPAFEKMKINPPKGEFFSLHNANAAAGIEQFKVKQLVQH